MNILLSRRLDHIVFVHSHRVEWWLKPGNGQSVGPWTWVNKPKYGWKQSTCSKRSFIFILANIILYTVYIYYIIYRYCIDILKTLTFFGSVLEAPQWIQPAAWQAWPGRPGLSGTTLCRSQSPAAVALLCACVRTGFGVSKPNCLRANFRSIRILWIFFLFIPSHIYIYHIFISYFFTHPSF